MEKTNPQTPVLMKLSAVWERQELQFASHQAANGILRTGTRIRSCLQPADVDEVPFSEDQRIMQKPTIFV